MRLSPFPPFSPYRRKPVSMGRAGQPHHQLLPFLRPLRVIPAQAGIQRGGTAGRPHPRPLSPSQPSVGATRQSPVPPQREPPTLTPTPPALPYPPPRHSCEGRNPEGRPRGASRPPANSTLAPHRRLHTGEGRYPGAAARGIPTTNPSREPPPTPPLASFLPLLVIPAKAGIQRGGSAGDPDHQPIPSSHPPPPPYRRKPVSRGAAERGIPAHKPSR